MAENPRIEELRRRVLADPASIAFAALAEEFRRVGRYDEAVETCRAGLVRHPAYLSARVTLGRALIETGDFEAAREELQTVLQSAPENLAAIRGLAQIHERLGHSAEMDPHLADMMNTLHAESLRAAAAPPPEPLPVAFAPGSEPVSFESEPPVSFTPAPEPALDFVSGPEPEFEPAQAAETTIALEPDPVPTVESSTDPFAAFTTASDPGPKVEPAYDFSLDLGARPPVLDLPITPVTDTLDLGQVAREAVELEAVEPEAAEPEADEPAAGEPEPVELETAGPDPAVLATLARLERFLDAIHSRRA